MRISTVLFDLDGTLLPMDMEKFSKAYFSGLISCLQPFGIEADELYAAFQGGINAMVKNNGGETNETVFWSYFRERFGDKVREMLPAVNCWYREDFEKIRSSCGFNPLAAKAVARCKAAGLRTVLATNPFFPRIATEARTRWAGLEPKDFELITTYENSCFCKPRPEYYREVLQKLGCSAEECLMVGNDTLEDTAAEQLGISVFLITDCLIDRKNAPLSSWDHGDFNKLIEKIEQL